MKRPKVVFGWCCRCPCCCFCCCSTNCISHLLGNCFFLQKFYVESLEEKVNFIFVQTIRCLFTVSYMSSVTRLIFASSMTWLIFACSVTRLLFASIVTRLRFRERCDLIYFCRQCHLCDWPYMSCETSVTGISSMSCVTRYLFCHQCD